MSSSPRKPAADRKRAGANKAQTSKRRVSAPPPRQHPVATTPKQPVAAPVVAAEPWIDTAPTSQEVVDRVTVRRYAAPFPDGGVRYTDLDHVHWRLRVDGGCLSARSPRGDDNVCMGVGSSCTMTGAAAQHTITGGIVVYEGPRDMDNDDGQLLVGSGKQPPRFVANIGEALPLMMGGGFFTMVGIPRARHQE